MLLHLVTAAGAMRTSVEFFDPIVRFGLAEPPSPPSSTMRPLMLVLPGLDGKLFVVGDGGDATPLTDFTVQELVAEPTIFGEGVLVGAKTVRHLP